MKSSSTIVGLALIAGCSASSPPAADAHEAERLELESAKARAEALEAELTARREEIRRLESELALLRSARPARPESVAIPSPTVDWDEPTEEEIGEASEPESDARGEAHAGPRIALKLHGEPTREAPAAEIFVREKQPAPAFDAPSAGTRVDRQALTHYRKALAAIKAKELEEALLLLELAIEHAHSLSNRIDAVFWRGEVLYLLGRYAEAEVEFASIVSADVDHPRLPASLLRLGQCRRSRGLNAEAEEIFELLRARFPGSHAAARSSREGV